MAPKPRWTGEGHGVQWGLGGLGLSMHWWPSNHTGAERDWAFDGGVAGWEQPFTTDYQSCVVHGRLVAKGCMVAAVQLPVFL